MVSDELVVERHSDIAAAPPQPSQSALALKDLVDGFKLWPLWTRLAWSDVRQRYRRSVLGPFWLTISMGVLVGTLGFIYSGLFRIDVANYLPYLTAGFIVWGLIASLINESCQTFTAGEQTIRQIALPYSMYAFRLVTNAYIITAHHLVIFVIVAVAFRVPVGASLLLALLGFGLIALNGMWIALLLGVICARFRDVPQIVASILHLSLFLTPVFWMPEQLPSDRAALVRLNPLHHFLELVRMPLLGTTPPSSTWLVVLGITVGGIIVTSLVFVRCRRRIAYWI